MPAAATSPRHVACPKCRAQPFQQCKRTKPGTVRIEFMKGFHAERRAAFVALDPTATPGQST